MRSSQFACRHFRLHLLLDAKIAHGFPVLTSGFYTRCLEVTLDALASGTDDTFLLKSDLLLRIRWRCALDNFLVFCLRRVRLDEAA